MAKRYKVWIQIEEEDTETEEYREVDVDFASTAVFDDEDEALDFAGRLHGVSEFLR